MRFTVITAPDQSRRPHHKPLQRLRWQVGRRQGCPPHSSSSSSSSSSSRGSRVVELLLHSRPPIPHSYHLTHPTLVVRLRNQVLQHGRISPITGEPISADILPNRALSRQLGLHLGLPAGAKPPCPQPQLRPPESAAAPGGSTPLVRLQHDHVARLVPSSLTAGRDGGTSRDPLQGATGRHKCRSSSVPTMRAR